MTAGSKFNPAAKMEKDGFRWEISVQHGLYDLDIVHHALEQGVVTGSMIPKIKCCLEAVDGGVGKAHILDGRVENVILLEMFTQSGVGSEITSK